MNPMPATDTPMMEPGRALIPPGQAIRSAIRWLSLERRDRPGSDISELAQEAAFRFELSSVETEFLVRTFSE